MYSNVCGKNQCKNIHVYENSSDFLKTLKNIKGSLVKQSALQDFF